MATSSHRVIYAAGAPAPPPTWTPVLAPYRRILALPGAWAFSLAAFVCRSPISMVGLGIVLLVADRTDSYGIAGAVSATAGVAGAVGSPVQGRLADRVGQHVVLPVTALVFVAGLGLLVLGVEADRLVLAFVGAALAGAALPQAGSMVRTRWRHATTAAGRRSLMQTAFAFEAVVDEVIFILGPIVVVAIATGADATIALALAATTGLLGAVALAVQRRTQPPVTRGDSGPVVREPLGWGRLAPVVVASIGLGTIFGSTEVVTVAFTEDRGRPGAAAVLLALWAGGSLLAGVAIGSIGSAWAPLRMVRVATLALGLSFVPMLLVESLVPAAVALLVSGIAISPSLVGTISLVERGVPAARLTEGMAWATTGLALGVAAGAAISGGVVDAAGSSAGYAVPLVAGALAVASAWVARDGSASEPEVVRVTS